MLGKCEFNSHESHRDKMMQKGWLVFFYHICSQFLQWYYISRVKKNCLKFIFLKFVANWVFNFFEVNCMIDKDMMGEFISSIFNFPLYRHWWRVGYFSKRTNDPTENDVFSKDFRKNSKNKIPHKNSCFIQKHLFKRTKVIFMR